MTKTLVTAAALVAASVTGALACPAHSEAKMSSEAGMAYDAASHSCKVVNS